VKKKTILILGSEGFIGSHLTDYFLRSDLSVVGCDLFETSSVGGYLYNKISRLSPEWETVFSLHQPDVCINAAGSGNVPYSIEHPVQDFEANTLDTIRLLDSIRRIRPECRYLHISSAAVYGNPDKLPLSENQHCQPVSPYGYHKWMSELICREYYSIFNIPVAVIRPFSVYGPRLRKQLMWDICSKLKNADTIELFGTGNESRDFIHIKDLAALVYHIVLSCGFECDIFNAASGKETPIKEIAGIFEEYHQGKKKIRFSGEVRKGDPLNWRAEISRSGALGFAPSVDLRSGLYEYIGWFEAIAKG
jgi:UDP-glucose 4-epimerase